MRSAGCSDNTYTDGPPVASPEQYEWNHGLGEIVQAVIDAGLAVTGLREHTECEWRALRQMVQDPDGKFRLPERRERLPLMFTLEARAPGPDSTAASDGIGDPLVSPGSSDRDRVVHV